MRYKYTYEGTWVKITLQQFDELKHLSSQKKRNQPRFYE